MSAIADQDRPPPRSGSTSGPETSARHHGPWAALVPLLVGFFMVVAGASVVSVATSEIATDLEADAGPALWVTSAYLVSLVAVLLVSGRLGDRFGPKNVYLVGLAVFTTGNLLAALSGDIGTLIAARAVQGFGASLMTPQSLTAITRLFPPERRAAAFGVWGATSGLALLAGPILGGVLIQLSGWPAIFLVNVPIGLVTAGLVIWLVPSFPRQGARFDIAGTVLSSGAVISLAIGLQQGPQVAWGSVAGWLTVPMLLGLGVVLLLAFIAWQIRSADRDPLVPLSLFRHRTFTLSSVAVFAAGFIATSLALPILIWAQDAQHLSPFESALLIAPMAIAQIALAPLVGRLVGRISPRTLAAAGFAGVMIALFASAALIGTDSPAGWLAVPNILLGMSSACIWGPLAVTATAQVANDQAGAASGVYNAMRQLGGVFGVAAISVGMQSTIAARVPSRVGADAAALGPVPDTLALPFGEAMGIALLIPTALALVGVAVSAGLRPAPVR